MATVRRCVSIAFLVRRTQRSKISSGTNNLEQKAWALACPIVPIMETLRKGLPRHGSLPAVIVSVDVAVGGPAGGASAGTDVGGGGIDRSY